MDGLTLALVKAGVENEASLLLWGGVVAMFAYVFWMVTEINRIKGEMAEMERRRQYMLRLLNDG